MSVSYLEYQLQNGYIHNWLVAGPHAAPVTDLDHFAGDEYKLLIARHYHTLGLTLSHYDARGHLVVARRIIDSITPGWQQVGAVWLPLPHLLNAIPVQIDWFYQTGASAVALSIAEYAIAAAEIAWIVQWLTRSTIAAVAGAAVFALNPNVLYLQSTPMTEPLLLATTTVAVAMLIRWCAHACRPGPLEPARGGPGMSALRRSAIRKSSFSVAGGVNWMSLRA